MKIIPAILASLSCVLLSMASFAGDNASLIPNGDFETATNGKPDGWNLGAGATWEADGDNHFLRLKTPQAGEQVLVFRAVAIAPDVKALELKYRVRYEGIKRGKSSWFDGRIMMN